MDRAKIVACLIVLLGAGCSRPQRIVVASKNFTEQVLLGEILAQQIERRLGLAVERKLNLGGTMLAHEALTKGDIDLYPEYTGTALTAVLKQPPVGDRAAAIEQVRAAYRSKWRLEWLSPLGFNNTFAMMVRGETARGAGNLRRSRSPLPGSRGASAWATSSSSGPTAWRGWWRHTGCASTASP